MNRIADTLVHTGANEELVRSLVSAGVEFVVIGGLAVAWYCSDRQADDMDILVEPTLENSRRISQVLKGLQLQGHVDDSFTKPGLQVPLKQKYYAEILTPKSDGPTYSEIADDAVDAKLFNIPVRVASVATLIQLKKHVLDSFDEHREKHMRDIESLKKLAI